MARKFYRYVYRIEVLSEEPIGSVSPEQIHYLINEGPCSGRFLNTTEQEIGPKRAARLLQDQGSDPEFFRLSPDGKDLDDD